jgi:hypothetical protein
MEQLYLRIKREKKTFFFEVSIKETIDNLKRRLLQFYKVELADMGLFLGKRVIF